jgi:hypothetical protein
MIVECNVWCVSNTKELIELGLDEGDTWFPFTFRSEHVIAVKLAGENDFLGDDKACIYIGGDHFTIDRTYKEVVKMLSI